MKPSSITVRSLEETIQRERQVQNEHLENLGGLREKNLELQTALSDELKKLEQIRTHLERERKRSGLAAGFRRAMSLLPWLKGRILTRRSIEALLRRQYEVSAERLKEAAELADRLAVAKRDLYDEIERLNEKIIQAAIDEKDTAQAIDRLKDALLEKRGAESREEPHTLESRRLEADIDRLEQQLAEHTAKLKLHSTAEERLDRLKDSTRKLAATVSQLQTDLAFYVATAGEKLDLISGQIQAIGAAADASLVMLELSSSLESLTESINFTTRFVSETQAYFRERVDGMVEDLRVFDEETDQVMAKNLALSQLDAEISGHDQ